MDPIPDLPNDDGAARDEGTEDEEPPLLRGRSTRRRSSNAHSPTSTSPIGDGERDLSTPDDPTHAAPPPSDGALCNSLARAIAGKRGSVGGASVGGASVDPTRPQKGRSSTASSLSQVYKEEEEYRLVQRSIDQFSGVSVSLAEYQSV